MSEGEEKGGQRGKGIGCRVSVSAAIAILESEWQEMQPGRYQTMWEDEEDAAWMNGFRHAIEFLREKSMTKFEITCFPHGSSKAKLWIEVDSSEEVEDACVRLAGLCFNAFPQLCLGNDLFRLSIDRVITVDERTGEEGIAETEYRLVQLKHPESASSWTKVSGMQWLELLEAAT